MLYIVANETAGHGKAKEINAKVQEYLRAAKREFCMLTTEYAGHARELAERAVQEKAEIVFALGGDGTVREVAQGLVGSGIPLGIIPAGTGNDIVKGLDLPKKPLETLQASLEKTPRLIDVGFLNGEPFLNIAGTGFDIETLQWTQKFKKHMRGILPYLLGVICSVVTHRDIDVRLTVEGQTRELSAVLVTVANGRTFGGGMRVAPHAVLDDGLFDVLVIRHCPKWKIPFLLPSFLNGNVEKISYAECMRAKQVKIERKGQTIDVDGELVDLDEAEFDIMHNGLMVLG